MKYIFFSNMLIHVLFQADVFIMHKTCSVNAVFDPIDKYYGCIEDISRKYISLHL